MKANTSGLFNNSHFVFACCYIAQENVPDLKSKTLTTNSMVLVVNRSVCSHFAPTCRSSPLASQYTRCTQRTLMRG